MNYFFLKYLLTQFATEERARDVENFFYINPMPGTEKAVAQAVETIRTHANLLKRNMNDLKKYLSQLNS